MNSPFDHYTVATEQEVNATAAAVARIAEKQGFQVLHIHDLRKIFGDQGFAAPPARVVEICFAAFGSQLLGADPLTSLMMPCRIAVYTKDGQTHISALRPRLVGEFFPQFAEMANRGDAMMRAIVDEAQEA